VTTALIAMGVVGSVAYPAMWLAEYYLAGAVLWWGAVVSVSLWWSKRVWSWDWGRELILATAIFAAGAGGLLELAMAADRATGIPFGYITWLFIVALSAGGVLFRATQSWMPAMGVAAGSSLAMAASSYQPDIALLGWMLPTSAMLFVWAGTHRIRQLARYSRLHQQCAHCEYSLDGVFVDSCPECGAEIPPGVVAGVFNGIGMPEGDTPEGDLGAAPALALDGDGATQVAAAARAKASVFAGAAASRSTP
jgi:hypothetical protein